MTGAVRPRLVVNPQAGRGRGRRRIRRLAGLADLEVREARGPAEMTTEARRAVDDGLDRLLVAGGDGAVHHAIQGLAGTPCALGIVPVGSGNDFARALGVERDPLSAGLRALGGTARPVDVGRVDGRVYAGVAGVGIDGAVSRLVHERWRWLGGPLAYLPATLEALLTFVPPRVRVEFDGGSHDAPALLVALANSPLFGGGMRIAPAARLDDAWLDLVIIEPVSLPVLLRVLPRVYRGRHVGHPAVHLQRVRRALVRTDPPATIHADGEPLFPTRPEGSAIEIWPAALRVVS